MKIFSLLKFTKTKTVLNTMEDEIKKYKDLPVIYNGKNDLTYEEAKNLSLKVRWKLTTCDQGDKCWCRVIEPEQKITDKDGEEIYITPSGSIPKLYAEHIVKLHNKSLVK